MGPVSILLLTETNRNAWQDWMELGIVPPILLLSIPNVVISSKLPISSGMVPLKSFRPNPTRFRVTTENSSGGMLPPISFPVS